MQGRLQGKRLHGQYFLDHVLEHGTEGCNYLLAVDVDMNTVDGYAMSSWERGYGDMFFDLDLDDAAAHPGAPGVGHDPERPHLARRQRRGRRSRRASVLKRQVDAAAEADGYAALAGTELEFIVFEDSYEQRLGPPLPRADRRPTATTSTTRSSAAARSSRCCARSATRCTPPA